MRHFCLIVPCTHSLLDNGTETRFLRQDCFETRFLFDKNMTLTSKDVTRISFNTVDTSSIRSSTEYRLNILSNWTFTYLSQSSIPLTHRWSARLGRLCTQPWHLFMRIALSCYVVVIHTPICSIPTFSNFIRWPSSLNTNTTLVVYLLMKNWYTFFAY